MSISYTKKMNKKCSTEGELIGVDDAMAKILCSRYFIEAQEYNISHNRIMQENKSAIILEKMSSSPAPSGPDTSRLGTSL